MRFLILGGDGMLGHQLYQRVRGAHEVKITLRQDFAAYRHYGLFGEADVYAGIDVRRTEPLLRILAEFRPQFVVNAVGIVKQRADAQESIPSIEINALLPHRLALLCRTVGARLIHMSTDCVFSGRDGNYSEASRPDPEDLYDRSKLLGEVQERHCITLRSSMIGLELKRKTSLVEWLLAQHGTVQGFRRAIFSGFTTLEMSRIIEGLALHHPAAHGLYHVSAAPISKYDLLVLLQRKLGLGVTIVPDDAFECDRSLDSTRFRSEFGYSPPTWEAMIDELATVIRDTRS
ncbi:MAG: dTDP-4-dehydrorhamnose reductase family protein [Betaproteobacteria bacterium]